MSLLFVGTVKEEEVLFNANAEFVLSNIEEKDGKHIIYLKKRLISYYEGVNINERLLSSGMTD